MLETGTKAPGDVEPAQSQESLAPAHLGCPEPKGSLLLAPPWQTDGWFPTCPGAVTGTRWAGPQPSSSVLAVAGAWLPRCLASVPWQDSGSCGSESLRSPGR